MRAVLVFCTIGLCLPSAALGQVLDRPAREDEGVFGGGRAPDRARLRHELTLTSSLLGGYDNITQTGAVDEDGIVQPRTTGSMGLFDTNLEYALIQTRHSFEVSGRGYLSTAQQANPLLGGDLRVAGSTDLGRRVRVSASQLVRNSPYLAIGEFGQLSSTVASGATPESDPTLGLADQRSWQTSTAGSFTWNWTTRQTFSAGGDYSQTRFQNDSAGFDSTSHGANVDYTWRFSRVASLHSGYTMARTEFENAAQNMTNHTMSGGFVYSRRLSRTRQVSVAADGGASYVEALSPTSDTMRGYWTPTASASVGIDIGRSWSASADYNRMATVLERVSVDTFYSNAVAVHVGGLIARRVDTTVMVGWTGGREATALDGTGRYETYTASAQLRYALARWCAAHVSYSYYDYTLSDIDVISGLPSASRSSGVRVGFTVWAPLHSSRGTQNAPR